VRRDRKIGGKEGGGKWGCEVGVEREFLRSRFDARVDIAIVVFRDFGMGKDHCFVSYICRGLLQRPTRIEERSIERSKEGVC